MDQPNGMAALGPDPIQTISRGDRFKLVMVLNRCAFDAKHIPGSLHFDTPDELHAARRPDDDIVVYCSKVDCRSSVAVYRELVRRGCQHVRRYSGGQLDWEDAGPPLEGNAVEVAR